MLKKREFTLTAHRSKERRLQVHWDMNNKYELAHLLYSLKEKDFIRIIHNKGYFTIAESHIVGNKGEVLKKNSLKKISSKINTDPTKYLDIIRQVNEVMEKLVKLKRDY